MEWMFGTHLQGPHQSVCWLRPKRARHFLGEPGSEHNAQHAQNKEEEKQKIERSRRRRRRRSRRKRRGVRERGEKRGEVNKGGKRHKSLSRQEKAPTGLSVQRKPSGQTVSSRLQHSKTSSTAGITTQHTHSQTSWKQTVNRDSAGL